MSQQLEAVSQLQLPVPPDTPLSPPPSPHPLPSTQHLLTPNHSLILQEPAYAAVLYDEKTPGHCDHCFARCARPLLCTRSRLARYCSPEHQRAAWVAGYREECEALVRCAPQVPPPSVRLAARVLWRRAR